MVALQVRDMSTECRDALAQEARRRGQSLQAYLHDVLVREAARLRNSAALAELAQLGGGVESADAAALIRAGRDEREAEAVARVR